MTPPKEVGNSFKDQEAEILDGPTLDDKLDTIIDLLRKNEREHEEIREELKQIKTNQDMLQSAYQQHGVRLGELMEVADKHWRHP